MRPVCRGVAPRAYADYADAIGDLESRLGNYCSYCERRFPGGLAVEHIVPKSLNIALEKEWDNFLIGCGNCNSIKGKKSTNKTSFLWPDIDNTLRAFHYSNGGLVQLANGLEAPIKRKAKKLMELVGLDRHPGQTGKKKSTPRDKRSQEREQVWALATHHRQRLAQTDTSVIRDMIIDAALGYGCFSIWTTVFAADTDMRRRLIAAFAGTAIDSFDGAGLPINRPGGRL